MRCRDAGRTVPVHVVLRVVVLTLAAATVVVALAGCAVVQQLEEEVRKHYELLSNNPQRPQPSELGR